MTPTQTLGIISHLDPQMAEITALSLMLDGAAIAGCTIYGLKEGSFPSSDAPSICFTPYTLDSTPTSFHYPIEIECLTCALRDAIIHFTLDFNDPVTIILPPGIELPHLTPGLSDAAEEYGIRLTGITHLLNAQTAHQDLLSHVSLDEKNLALIDGDERCIAEVHQLNLAYADALLVIGSDAHSGRELIEHLRPHDVLLFEGLDADILPETTRITHNPDASMRRVHPATTQAWGGPCDFGTWTLDLYSEKPFHPTRLKELVTSLCAKDVYARGCFWIPTRPNTVCAWEGIGEVLTVGPAGQWSDLDTDSGEPTPHCHLILTGVGSPDIKKSLEEAFAHLLLGEDEDLLAWVGAHDGLDEWLGEQS